jgi:tRNA 2-thiouridine synthesizing protein A
MLQAFSQEVDARGLLCPEPIMMLHGAVRDAGPGEVIRVLATDPSTVRDISQFCEFLGHELVAHSQQREQFIFYVRKKPA